MTSENFRIFEKMSFKIAKTYYFSIFSKFLQNHALNFRAFGRKTQRVGIFMKNIIGKLQKFIYLA